MHYKYMPKINLQIRLPEETAEDLDQVVRGSRSAFVREAIAEKIRRERDKLLEEQWIAALKRGGDEAEESRDWLKVETWEDR